MLSLLMEHTAITADRANGQIDIEESKAILKQVNADGVETSRLQTRAKGFVDRP